MACGRKDRKKTLDELKTFLDTKVAPKEIVDELKVWLHVLHSTVVAEQFFSWLLGQRCSKSQDVGYYIDYVIGTEITFLNVQRFGRV